MSATTQPIAKVYFEDQVRSRERVRDLAEVYTHDREITAMLNLVADMFPSEDDPENIDRTFLEPACGHGNFLVAIISRKMKLVTVERYGKGPDFEYRLLRCFTSTYGIDIDQANVVEARERMLGVLEGHLRNTGVYVSQALHEAVSVVLSTNVQRADTLSDAKKIELVEYLPVGDGYFQREWSFLEGPEQYEQLDLFSELPAAEPGRDKKLVHYRDLPAVELSAVAS